MKKKINTGIFVISNSLSGAEKRFIRLAREMCGIREDIVLITNIDLIISAEKDNEINEIINWLRENNKISILNNDGIKNTLMKSILTSIQLFFIIRKRRIKTLHCSLGAIQYAFLKRILRVDTILELTSPDIVDKVTSKKMYINVLKKSDKIIAVSESVSRKVAIAFSELKLYNQINKVICFDIPFFLPNKKIVESSNISKKRNLIVYASRLIERKNPILFAKAISKLLDTHNNWDVAILGTGPLESEVKEILKDHIESGKVIVEYTANIYGYLLGSMIFVSLIWPDNYPSQSILEAMYSKNAIIATNVGSTYRFVGQSNGFLIEEYKVDKVLETLEKAILSTEKLKEMGNNSYDIVTKNFSKDIYLSKLSSLYDSLY